MIKEYKTKFKILGENIKRNRIKKHITLKELSIKTGIRVEYLRKIEDGTAYGLTTTRFINIASGLGVLPHILAEGI